MIVDGFEVAQFQSPDGDFVYSDLVGLGIIGAMAGRFQSPDGDFVYSDW